MSVSLCWCLRCNPRSGRRERAPVVDCHGRGLPQLKVAIAGSAVGRTIFIDRARRRGERVATVAEFFVSWSGGGTQYSSESRVDSSQVITYDAQQAMYPLDQLSLLWVFQPDGHTRGLMTGTTELEELRTEL